MRAPAFWQRNGFLPVLLSPLAALYAAATAARVARPGWRAPVPVICCGNVTAGGAGKTTLALDLGARLIAQGVSVAFLTRGYGGRATGSLEVQLGQHSPREVGDEALLLAAVAPTFVAADRAAGARAAIAAGARVLVMDDGLQNPSLVKDFSLLVIDGADGFGNGRVIPAGPLREPVAAAAARCQVAVLVGEDHCSAAAALPSALPILRAHLQAGAEVEKIVGQPVLAFAGIGRPEKFFATLEAAGVRVVRRMPFADHHAFSTTELRGVLDEAARLGAVAVTTPKDAVRIPPAFRENIRVVGVQLIWANPASLEALLDVVLRSP